MEDQKKQETEEKIHHPSFLERLKLRELVRSPIRNWLAWAGIVLFVALIITYYLTTGGGS